MSQWTRFKKNESGLGFSIGGLVYELWPKYRQFRASGGRPDHFGPGPRPTAKRKSGSNPSSNVFAFVALPIIYILCLFLYTLTLHRKLWIFAIDQYKLRHPKP